MKKMSAVLVGLMLIVNMLYAETSFEAFQAGYAKKLVADYSGAIVDFRRSVTLSVTEVGGGYEPYSVQGIIGNCFYDQADYDNAIIEFQKAIARSDVTSVAKSQFQMNIGNCYYNKGDKLKAKDEFAKVYLITDGLGLSRTDSQNQVAQYFYSIGDKTNAKIEFAKVLTISNGNFSAKNEAIIKLTELGADWNTVLAGITVVKTWDDYYFKAVVEKILTQYASALSDIQIAVNIVGEDKQNRSRVLQKREDICMDGFGLTYSDWKVQNP